MLLPLSLLLKLAGFLTILSRGHHSVADGATYIETEAQELLDELSAALEEQA